MFGFYRHMNEKIELAIKYSSYKESEVSKYQTWKPRKNPNKKLNNSEINNSEINKKINQK